MKRGYGEKRGAGGRDKWVGVPEASGGVELEYRSGECVVAVTRKDDDDDGMMDGDWCT